MFFRKGGDSLPELSHKRIDKPDRSIYYNHIHNHCEILLFKSVKGEYNIDGQILTPSPDYMLFVPAATYHYVIPSPDTPYENYVIGIEPSVLKPAHYQKLFSQPLMINVKDDGVIQEFFRRLDMYARDYSEEDFCACSASMVHELVTYLSYHKDELTSIRSRSIGLVDRMIGYINENIESNINADSVARHFMLSKSYVQNLFSQHMHIGLKKYINQKKIYAAHSDLMGGLSPYQVCDKYGFGDYSAFFRVFRQTFGTSPGKVR